MANDGDLKRLAARLKDAPVLTVVSDGAIKGATLEEDSFELSLRIGPIYDIVRHPATDTPTAIAIYGDWGAGKTSAMRWLEGRLRDWNAQKGPVGKISVWPVWFYPWKYQSREDVWRGLIAQVIISYLTERRSVAKTIVEEAKDLGVFLGKSFADLLAGLKVTAGGKAGKVTFDLKQLKAVAENAQEYLHPEAGHLNEFEAALKKWVKKALPGDDRMVIFIDDLDRCMPDIALSVLEALKLYLDIDRLIFVVGVDKPVVDQLVKKYYENLGVSADKSRDYLAKMFQIEATIAPTDTQVGDFLDEVVRDNDVWDALDEVERGAFRDVILSLAPHSPREIKRLVNSALIAGVGADMSSLAWGPKRKPVRVAQGIQVFFVRRILDQRFGRGLVVSQSRGTEFFRAWSQAVMSRPETESGHFDLPPTVAALLRPGDDDMQSHEREEKLARAISEWTPASEYAPLFERPFRPFLEFLQDEDLGRLMRIDYPEEAAVVGGEGSPRAREIVDEAVRERYGKVPAEMTDEERQSVTGLNFRSYSDLDDVAPLAGLAALQSLDLQGTQVSDVAPLAGLTALLILQLQGTQVSDVAPLAGLAALLILDLQGTQVSDVAPLARLTALESLHLQETRVSDVTPLAGLAALQSLHLKGTRVSDVAPLAGLAALQLLDLQGTQVSDVAPLEGLLDLARLWLRSGQVSDEEINRLKEALPNLRIEYDDAPR